MTSQLFDIWIDTEDVPGTAQIEIFEGGPTARHPRASLAVKHVPDRGDIPGSPCIHRYNTGAPASMVQFALLPDWIRNDALEALAEAFVFLEQNPSGYDTHTKNA